MVNVKPLDPDFPIQQQLGIEAGPVVLVNIFTVDPSEEDALVEAWRNDALYMKKQPGYISTQLHKAIGGSGMFMNYAVWDSVEDFRNAFSNPDFQAHLDHYPSSAATAPHLFEKIAVPNCCTA